MLKNAISWILEKLGHVAADGIGTAVTQLEPVFVIVAMVGVFLIMLGEKRFGTKLTSFSIIFYTVTKVIS